MRLPCRIEPGRVAPPSEGGSEVVAARKQLKVPPGLSRGRSRGEERELASAAWLIEDMCQHVGVPDLHDTEMLDVGCGVKFTKLFINHDIPIERYVGLDVYGEMIEFLRRNVDDPRFEYHHMNLKNDLYNPSGDAFTEDIRLPLGHEAFDLICLFSVFTHLPPPDYRTMLKVLRRHIRPNGRLFFTLYINELTPGGHGLVDAWSKNYLVGREDVLSARVAERLEAGLPAIEPFIDLDPAKPLHCAVYSKEYAHELIEGTGWEVLSLSEPDAYIQHHFVCAPVPSSRDLRRAR